MRERSGRAASVEGGSGEGEGGSREGRGGQGGHWSVPRVTGALTRDLLSTAAGFLAG